MLSDLRTYLESIGVPESNVYCKRTTAEAFAMMLTWDGLVTQLSRTLRSYNGTGDAAVKYGGELLGVYRVFEKYHKIIRER